MRARISKDIIEAKFQNRSTTKIVFQSVCSVPRHGKEVVFTFLFILAITALYSEIFGEDLGIGVRSAVGMTLPGNIPVEIEAKFELYN